MGKRIERTTVTDFELRQSFGRWPVRPEQDPQDQERGVPEWSLHRLCKFRKAIENFVIENGTPYRHPLFGYVGLTRFFDWGDNRQQLVTASTSISPGIKVTRLHLNSSGQFVIFDSTGIWLAKEQRPPAINSLKSNPVLVKTRPLQGFIDAQVAENTQKKLIGIG